jgi:lysophospholipid acyltransferase (LPLAT)-like uncharacterized protein
VKRFLRLGSVQSVLALLLTLYVRIVSATMRWRFDQADQATHELGLPGGGMLFFWHGRIALAVTCRKIVLKRSWRAMISLSPDGEFVTKAAARLGFPAIRGSTGRRAWGKGKGGGPAFMEALDFIAAEGGVIVTPDGPRGPAEIMQAGPIMLAKRAQTRVFLAGLASRPTLRLNTWDHTRLPLPFSRGCALIEGPLRIPADADRAAIEALREDWQRRLVALQAKADAMLDEPHP